MSEFLLTYFNGQHTDYVFFESEAELKEFVADNPEFRVMGAIEFKTIRDITNFTIGEN